MNESKLFICPTPIGNLGDVTIRVLETLRSVDVICAEDTRVTSRLLAAYDIEKRIERLDEEALSKHLPRIIERLQQGETIAYCSDAGMPGVSDPGLRLVEAARAAGVAVEVLPGASAAVTAYVTSGSVDQRFFFGGFLPRKAKECAEMFTGLKDLDAALIFYESPSRLLASLETIATVFPLRTVTVCRELTKLHEEVARASAVELHALFSQRCETSSIKGEIVIVIDSAPLVEREEQTRNDEMNARERALALKAEGGHSNKDIAMILQKEYSISRNAAYDIAMSS